MQPGGGGEVVYQYTPYSKYHPTYLLRPEAYPKNLSYKFFQLVISEEQARVKDDFIDCPGCLFNSRVKRRPNSGTTSRVTTAMELSPNASASISCERSVVK